MRLFLDFLQANRNWLYRRYSLPRCYRDQAWFSDRSILRYRDCYSRSCHWQGTFSLQLDLEEIIVTIFLQELEGNNVEGVLVIKSPWPSIARTIYQDHKRYQETYMAPYPGTFYTGDGAARDEHGYIWIKGRVDGALHPISLKLDLGIWC